MDFRMGAAFSYLGVSLGWLAIMGGWAFAAGPYVEPRCQPVSFGFLPGVLVVSVGILVLYALTVVVHAILAFRGHSERKPNARSSVYHAMFFVPFAGLAVVMLAGVMSWSASLHCFAAMAVLAVPYVVTPVANAVFARQYARPRY